MKLLDMYSLLISNWINSGGFAKRGKMQASSMNVGYNVIFTRDYVTQVYHITGIKPLNHDIAFIDYIRDKMFELNPDVEVNIQINNHPVKLDVNSDKFTRAFTKASDAYSTYKEAFESQSGIARITGKTYRLPGGGRLRLSRDKLDMLKQVYMSYLTLFNNISSGGTACLCEMFIEITGKELRTVKRAGDDLYGVLGAVSIGCELLKSVNKPYLLQCGTATPAPQTLNKKFLPQLLFTTENSAAFSTYKSRGLVGGGKGALLFGMDFRSRLPLSVDLFKSGSAQVFMLLGKTGSGKTYSAFQLAISALALGEYVTAIDIKGREWSQITSYSDARIITFDDRSPSFVNTLRLDDLDVTSKNSEELYNTAVKGTVQLFMLVINTLETEGNINDTELVVREAVEKMLSMRGVDPNNPDTFKNTAGIKYSEVLPILESLQSTSTYTNEQRHILSLARVRLNAYFGEAGLFADNFRNEISLADVLDSKFVIYEFNKNQGAMTDILDVIRVFMVQFLDSKKKAMLKEKGKFLFCFYEELQRCEQFGNLLEYICADVTGSRSNNAVIILLLNSLKVLQGERARDIRSNITSFLVGYVEDNDIRTIRDDFGKPWLANQLSLFSAKQNIYRNCFAAEIDTGIDVFQTIYKVAIPEAYSRTFRTRTIKE